MQEDKVEIKDRDVVILGAGGVGRAIAFLCAQKGAQPGHYFKPQCR